MTGKQIFQRLRKRALKYPEATEDHPWGETAVKVNGKVFIFLGSDGASFKLPQSRDMAHDLPFAEPTHYGLGKHGWVTARFGGKSKPSIGLLEAWLDESYRAVAPKKMVTKLELKD